MTWEVEEVRSGEICPGSCHSKQTVWVCFRANLLRLFPLLFLLSFIDLLAHSLAVSRLMHFSFELPHQRGSGSDGAAGGIHMLTHHSLLCVSSLVSPEPLPQGKISEVFICYNLLCWTDPSQLFTLKHWSLRMLELLDVTVSKVCKTSLHNGLLK